MVDDGPRRITVVDTAIASTNVGDEIIMDAVNKEISELFPDARQYRVASHERMAGKSHRLVRRSSDAILGGANLLSAHAALRSVWQLSPLDTTLGKNSF